MTPITLTESQMESVDDMARFANQVSCADLNALIEAKKRPYRVEILVDGEVRFEEWNVMALTNLEAAQQVKARTPGNYGFRPVAQ